MTEADDLRRLINGYRVSQALYVAATLGISDHLAGGPVGVDVLAGRTQSHPRALYRLLRALATVGIYDELPGQQFRLTSLGNALRSDVPEAVTGWAAFVGRPYHWQAWSELLHSVQTGENAFRFVFGEDVWAYRESHPDENAVFDAAMTTQSRFVAQAVLDAYDFTPFGTVVDVGGGRGAFLSAVLNRYPRARGVLFDQPHVVAGSAELLSAAGVADRCHVDAGSFFDRVPVGGDAYVLKNIIHDWEDDPAVEILTSCRRDMPDAATVLLIERVIQPLNEDQDAAFSDLNMLVSPGGQERTEPEYDTLLRAAGLRLRRTVHTTRDVWIIEATLST